MDEMPSSEFRRRYASLTQPTAITVLGRRIGVWMPVELLDHWDAKEEDQHAKREGSNVRQFNSRPFTPAPKKGK